MATSEEDVIVAIVEALDAEMPLFGTMATVMFMAEAETMEHLENQMKQLYFSRCLPLDPMDMDFSKGWPGDPV